MTCAGFKAQLNFSSENGEVLVSFNVNLGSITSSSHSLPYPISNRHRPPSYYRRQLKRKMKMNKDLSSSSEDQAVPSAAVDSGDAKTVSNVRPLESLHTNESGLVNEIGNVIAKPNVSLSFSEAHVHADTKQVAVLEENDRSSLEQPLLSDNVKCTSSHQIEDSGKLCCIHIHRPGTPPRDGKCCFHRCRPNWTREQRAKNYGEWELLSQPNLKPNPTLDVHGQKNR